MIISRSNTCKWCGPGHTNSCYIVYTDGAHCYSCGKFERTDAEFNFMPKRRAVYVPEITYNPKQFSLNVLMWLNQYYIYDDLIKLHNIGYVPAEGGKDESLIFTVGDTGEFQRRFFPKAFYSSEKVKQQIYVTGPESKAIVVCEDVLSTIRVGGAGFTSMCLFGTSANPEQIRHIVTKYTETICIWLDPDEAGIKGALKLKATLESNQSKYPFMINPKIKIITSDLQPKEKTNAKIIEILTRKDEESSFNQDTSEATISRNYTP